MIIKVKNEIESIYNYTRDEITEGIERGFAYFSEVANAQFEWVTSGQQITFRSDSLYRGRSPDGGYIHAGGTRRGNTIYLHSGFYRDSQSPRDGDYRSDQKIPNLKVMGSISGHEIGHWFGWGHSADTSCLMHSNASASELCPGEKQRIIAQLGPQPKPEDPPVPEPIQYPDGTLIKGTKVNFNNPEVVRGSMLVVDGSNRRVWAQPGDRVVIIGGTVEVHERAAKPNAMMGGCCEGVVD